MSPRLAGLGLSLLLPALAAAQQATLSFVGTVQKVQAGTAYPALGSTITGTFVFDYAPGQSSTGGLPGEGASYAYHQFAGPPYGLSADYTGLGAVSGNLAIEVFDDGSRLFPNEVPNDTASLTTKRNNVLYSLQLSGPNASFAGTAIPSKATWESFWTQATFIIRDGNVSFGQSTLTASVSSVSVTVVPEPAQWALFGIGLAALTVRHHARARQSARFSRQRA